MDDLIEAATDESDRMNKAQEATTACADVLHSPQSPLLSTENLCHVAYEQMVHVITGAFEADYFKHRKLLNGMLQVQSRRMNDS